VTDGRVYRLYIRQYRIGSKSCGAQGFLRSGRQVHPDEGNEGVKYLPVHAEVDLLLTGKDDTESWVEMSGAGSVDPNVFDAVGIDSEKRESLGARYAFAIGGERLVVRKYEITDLRFVRQARDRLCSPIKGVAKSVSRVFMSPAYSLASAAE